MRSLSLCLLLGLVSLSLASLPASVMLEDLRDEVHRNPGVFQNHEDFKSFDSKRVSDGFWVRILKVLQVNNLSDSISIVSSSSLTNFTKRKEASITAETITQMRFFEALAKMHI